MDIKTACSQGVRYLIYFVISILLVSCGGGGSEGSSDDTAFNGLSLAHGSTQRFAYTPALCVDVSDTGDSGNCNWEIELTQDSAIQIISSINFIDAYIKLTYYDATYTDNSGTSYIVYASEASEWMDDAANVLSNPNLPKGRYKLEYFTKDNSEVRNYPADATLSISVYEAIHPDEYENDDTPETARKIGIGELENHNLVRLHYSNTHYYTDEPYFTDKDYYEIPVLDCPSKIEVNVSEGNFELATVLSNSSRVLKRNKGSHITIENSSGDTSQKLTLAVHTIDSMSRAEVFAYTVLLTAECEEGPSDDVPPVSVGLSASYKTYNDRVVLNWTNAINTNGYVIYRSSSIDGEYSNIASLNANELTYSDFSADAGKDYYYKIRTYNNWGSNYSPARKGAISDSTEPPIAPTWVKASDGLFDSSVLIRWNPSAGATSYSVQRSTNANSGYHTIAVDGYGRKTSNGVPIEYSYSDETAEQGVVYFYRIKAINEFGSSYSVYDSGFRDGLVERVGDLEFVLTWSHNGTDLGPDFDLHVVDPDSVEWYYGNALNNTNPNLDIDDRGNSGHGDGNGPERMYWSSPESGVYSYSVVLFANSSNFTRADYQLRVYIQGELVARKSGVFVDPEVGDSSQRYTIEY